MDILSQCAEHMMMYYCEIPRQKNIVHKDRYVLFRAIGGLNATEHTESKM